MAQVVDVVNTASAANTQNVETSAPTNDGTSGTILNGDSTGTDSE